MDVYQALRSENATIATLLDRLTQTTSGESDLREALFDDLRRRIEHVIAVEERFLYPIVALHPDAQALVEASRRDNDAIERLLDELRAMATTDVEFPTSLARLRREVRRHIDHEERELFRRVDTLVSVEHSELLARQLDPAPSEGAFR